ncbi:MAG TPA: TonB-dependent receptor [Chitinophagales bacterium]|nr:TonB-dependent receptor [Chitinophagales bacterium]HQW79249.1 TonB-dependent receptor [Chitinophagales bacterium]HRB66224.1 TonB-dependent receptor [Chitinophagales bacterium]
MKLTSLLIFISFSISSFAQKIHKEKDTTRLIDKINEIPSVFVRKSNKEFTIKGKVIDKITNESLIGVNIFVETDKLRGTVTDFDGNYELKANEGDVIVFTYLGLKDSKHTVTGNETLNLNMEEEGNVMDEIVVSVGRKKEKALDAPASIVSVEAAAIKNKAGLGISEYIRNSSGVQVMKTGVGGGQPSVRGFAGYFSSDVMSLTDTRVAKLPNTGLNMYQMMTTTDADIERIEILKGPAAALYGPNANQGVIHIITKSPLKYQEVKFWTSIGARVRIKDTLVDINRKNPKFDYKKIKDRALFTLGFYVGDTIHVKNPNVKTGIKFSGQFFTGHDWRYSNLGDPALVTMFSASTDTIYYERPDGSVDPNGKGVPIDNDRDEKILNGQVDGRYDIQIKEDFNIVLAGGVNVSNGIIPSPIGAIQNKGWTYSWAQMRFTWKNLFVQAYMNSNNSRGAYFVPVGGRFVDKSKMYSVQAQHSVTIKKRVDLIYGFDAFFTRPDTKGTLNGRYEDKDAIDEYGVYLQGEYRLHPRFSTIVATRLDYNTAVKKLLFSPKVAIVYKPGTGHNLRFTFNRAFKNPASAAYFVDVKQADIPQGIEVRQVGTPYSGFNYSFNANPNYGGQVLPQFLSPYGTNGQFHDVGDLSFNSTGWDGILSAIKSQFGSQANISENSPILPLINDIVNSIIPQTIPSDMPQVVKNLNTGKQEFESNNDQWMNTKNIAKLKPTMTYTYELGYKGVIGKMFGLQVDVYRTDYKDYLAPVQLLTPAIMFDDVKMMEYLAPKIAQNYNNLNPLLQVAMNEFLDKSEKFGGNNNGTASDEFVALINRAVQNLPIGVITPYEANGPNMILVTRNVGNLTVYGVDFNSNLYLPYGLSLNANYSFVSKDSAVVKDSPLGYVALNSPKHRVNVGLNYNNEKIGLNIGVKFNWSAGYPVLSGNFIGHQTATNDMDFDVSYTPKFLKDHFNVTVSISNLYNKKQQYFVGSPTIGLMGVCKFTYTL